MPSRPRPAGRGEAQHSRVLVVDDNVETARALARLLKLLVHDVRTAHDGPSAIDAARDHRPDFVLLDIGLPGMDGYELARRIRSGPSGRDITLIALTGYGQAEDFDRSRDAGFDHHFVKPAEMQAIQAVIDAASDDADVEERRTLV